jgi:hypothetical protein
MERHRHSHRRSRRLVLYGGLAFLLVGGPVAIVINRPQPATPRRIPPVVITGRVISHVRGVKGGRLPVVLRPSGGETPGNLADNGGVKTDHFGNFQVRSHYRGLADVFVPPEPSARWISRPLRNVSVPAASPIEIVLIEGTAVRGRLVRAGKPVANATVELFLVDRNSLFLEVMGTENSTQQATDLDDTGGFSSWGALHSPARLADTDGKGFFAFRNLPEDTEFGVRSRVGSLPDQGAFAPRKLRTGVDKS